MKKVHVIRSLVFLAIALIAVACEKEPEELLVGKWEIQTMSVKTFTNDVKEFDFTINYDPDEVIWEFLEGGTGNIYYDGDLDDTFEWTVSGDNLLLTLPDADYPLEMTFSVDKESLSLSGAGSETDPESGDVYKSEIAITAKRK